MADCWCGSAALVLSRWPLAVASALGICRRIILVVSRGNWVGAVMNPLATALRNVVGHGYPNAAWTKLTKLLASCGSTLRAVTCVAPLSLSRVWLGSSSRRLRGSVGKVTIHRLLGWDRCPVKTVVCCVLCTTFIAVLVKNMVQSRSQKGASPSKQVVGEFLVFENVCR